MKHTTKYRIRFGCSSHWALIGLAATAALNLLVHRADAATTFTSVGLTEGGATLALKFNSEAGQTYRVETSPTLAAGTWADAGVSVEGDGGEKGFNIPTAGLGGAHFFRVIVQTFMEMVPVGDGGNAPDPGSTSGSVAYDYRIGKYEVTNAQYAAFLNSVAATDRNNLYNSTMGSDARGGIRRSGALGSYTYAIKPNMGDKPVNCVSWYDALRFCNWLHNGRPNGAQDNNTTEDGAYKLTGTTTVTLPGSDPNHGANGRKAGARYHLPSDNEWYKAAYHQPAAQGGDSDNYWLYPTRSNVAPKVATADTTGHIKNDSVNIANYDFGADWNGQDGNVTTVGSGGSGSASYYGAFDMAGNVTEWTEQSWGIYRVGRGGALSSYYRNLESSDPDPIPPTDERNYFGFRVAAP